MEIQLTAEGDKLVYSPVGSFLKQRKDLLVPLNLDACRVIGHHHLNSQWPITATRASGDTIVLSCVETCLKIAINGLYETYPLLENLFSRQPFMRPTRRGMPDDDWVGVEATKDKEVAGQPAEKFYLSKGEMSYRVTPFGGITKDTHVFSGVGGTSCIGTIDNVPNSNVYATRMKIEAPTVIFCPTLGIRATTYSRTFRTIGDKGNITVVDGPLPILT